MEEPTDADLQRTGDVLCWLVDMMREHTPSAYNSIAVMEEAMAELPGSIEEFKEDWE